MIWADGEAVDILGSGRAKSCEFLCLLRFASAEVNLGRVRRGKILSTCILAVLRTPSRRAFITSGIISLSAARQFAGIGSSRLDGGGYSESWRRRNDPRGGSADDRIQPLDLMNTKCIFLIAFAGVFFAVLVCGNLEQLNHQQPKTSLTLSIMALFHRDSDPDIALDNFLNTLPYFDDS